MTVAFTISALLLGIIGAVAAGTVTPPPKIAFVTTNANVAPDALTVGPMAGRLGAPLFITNKEALGDATKDALIAYGADLIIVAGGPGTVTDAVLAQIAAATGKTIAPENTAPASGIVRVYGSGRDQTAVALSTLIASYNPKFLPTNATAADADLLDGMDSTAFLGATAKAADADKLDGIDSAAFVQSADVDMLLPVATFAVDSTGTLLFASSRAPLNGDPIVTWDAGWTGYLVELPGVGFSINDDSAICSTSAGSAYTVTTDSVGGDLLVRIWNASNTAVQSWATCAIYSND